MNDRTRTPFLFLILVVILVLVLALTSAGCGVNQPNRFQTSFLPAAPHPTASRESSDLPAAPDVKSKIELKDVPRFLLENPRLPDRKTRGDLLMLQADERFQRGKRYYESGDFAGARREFDSAIDSMLEASEFIPADRQEYERRLDQLADSIHCFDLADLVA